MNTILYPPIVDTYAPTFIIKENQESQKVPIVFSLSHFNIPKDIKYLHLSIRSQNTNKDLLKEEMNGIKNYSFKDILFDDKTTPVKGIIWLSAEDLREGKFNYKEYYKIQLRFVSSDLREEVLMSGPEQKCINMAWLAKNKPYFSEWSKICLLHGIGEPVLNFNFEKVNMVKPDSYELPSTQPNLSGKFSFKNDDREFIKNYEIVLKDSNNKIVQRSGMVYPSINISSNEINYIPEQALEENIPYYMEVHFVTSSNYISETEISKWTYQIKVIVHNTPSRVFFDDFIIEKEPDFGSFKIHIKNKSIASLTTKIIFRRTSSRSNFKKWEDIYETELVEEPLDLTWRDSTIESGIWYKYGIQQCDEKGNRGIFSIIQKPEMLIFEDVFLCANDKQLRIKYNPNISNYKLNISESKIDTIGSKFPFIRRNSAMEYRSFSISGLITAFMDYQENFVKIDDLYTNKEIHQYYKDYNKEELINDFSDTIKEREFRNEVISFLYENSVKLFKSNTEGNIIIKLMDISLTPETALGRMLYSFSATAYEIDENNLKNLKKYHIFNKKIEKEKKKLPSFTKKVGSFSGVLKKDTNLIDEIYEKYKNLLPPEYNVIIDNLDSLQIEFKDKPYLVGFLKPDKGASIKLVPYDADLYPEEKILKIALGYIIKINNKDIYVNPDGVFSLIDDTSIKQLSFPVDTDINITYDIQLSAKENEKYILQPCVYYTTIGQLWGSFDYKSSLLSTLWKKYYFNTEKQRRELFSINGIQIEADPGTTILLKDLSSKNFKKFIINENCLLSLKQEDSIIENIIFTGKTLIKERELQIPFEYNIPSNKYIKDSNIYEKIEDIEQPIQNMVYTFSNNLNLISTKIDKTKKSIDLTSQNFLTFLKNEEEKNKTYIYNNSHWYLFIENKDLTGQMICPINAIVNYECDIMKM